MPLIRRAVVSDAPTIAQVHAASIREVCSEVYPGPQIERWASTKRPERYLQSIAHSAFFVAELDGELVGFSHLDLESGEVHAVYVRPDRLRRGIGALLLVAVEAAAREAGLERIALRSSLNAVRFYEAQGFVAIQTSSFCLAPGLDLACTSMQKSLREAP